MNELSGYVFAPLRGDIALFRGHRNGLSPIPLATVDERSIDRAERLEHEYALKSELDADWAAQPVALLRVNSSLKARRATMRWQNLSSSNMTGRQKLSSMQRGLGRYFCYLTNAQIDRGRAGEAMLARRTANIPVRKMPSNVPAPPMDATGAPRPFILFRLSRSAPISVPNEPQI